MKVSYTSDRNFSASVPQKKDGASALVDLLDVDLGGAAGLEAQGAVGGIVGPDPWAPKPAMSTAGGMADPWSASSSTVTSPQDPWNPSASAASTTAAAAGMSIRN